MSRLCGSTHPPRCRSRCSRMKGSELRNELVQAEGIRQDTPDNLAANLKDCVAWKSVKFARCHSKKKSPWGSLQDDFNKATKAMTKTLKKPLRLVFVQYA